MVRLFGKGDGGDDDRLRSLDTEESGCLFSMQPLFSGRFGQRMAAGRFCGIGSRKAKMEKWCEYFVSFGEEEAVKMAEQYLDIRIRRIPTAEERIDGYGRVHDFFWKIPTISEADLGL